MKTHTAKIENNGKCLHLDITEFKTLYRCYVNDYDTKRACYYVGTLRVYKYKGMNLDKALEIFRQMCINNRWC